MLEINSSQPGILNETMLKILEKQWEFGLPKPYRDFLLKYNGGEPNPCCFDFKTSESDGSDVRIFFGITLVESMNLLQKLKIFEKRLPGNIFPIGRDSFGNLICISVKGADRGKIYFWDHEMEAADGEKPDYSNLTLIADSFDEFLNSLHDIQE